MTRKEELTEERASRILKRLANRDRWIDIIASKSWIDEENRSGWYILLTMKVEGESMCIAMSDKNFHPLCIMQKEKPSSIDILKFILKNKDNIFSRLHIIYGNDTLESLLIEDDLETGYARD